MLSAQLLFTAVLPKRVSSSGRTSSSSSSSSSSAVKCRSRHSRCRCRSGCTRQRRPPSGNFFQLLVFYARLSRSAGPRGLLICFRVLLSCPNFAKFCCPFYLARFRCCLVHLSFSLFYFFLYHFWSLGLTCFLYC